MEKIYKELEEAMKKGYNSNFHMDKMDWRDREILKNLCKILDKRLKDISLQTAKRYTHL